MLQRIYGTSFPTEEALEAHLQMLEEAKRRDHRVLGKELGLFHIDEAAGGGLVYWLPKGPPCERLSNGSGKMSTSGGDIGSL